MNEYMNMQRTRPARLPRHYLTKLPTVMHKGLKTKHIETLSIINHHDEQAAHDRQSEHDLALRSNAGS